MRGERDRSSVKEPLEEREEGDIMIPEGISAPMAVDGEDLKKFYKVNDASEVTSAHPGRKMLIASFVLSLVAIPLLAFFGAGVELIGLAGSGAMILAELSRRARPDGWKAVSWPIAALLVAATAAGVAAILSGALLA